MAQVRPELQAEQAGQRAVRQRIAAQVSPGLPGPHSCTCCNLHSDSRHQALAGWQAARFLPLRFTQVSSADAAHSQPASCTRVAYLSWGAGLVLSNLGRYLVKPGSPLSFVLLAFASPFAKNIEQVRISHQFVSDSSTPLKRIWLLYRAQPPPHIA